MCSPNKMITAPANRLKIGRRSIRNWPAALAVAPSAMNTTEKPRMKASDATTMRVRVFETATTVPLEVPRISSSDSPDT